jgi:hypothetical protein
MSRGARRQNVFLDDRSCARFLELLAALPARFGVEVHGYALMPNHLLCAAAHKRCYVQRSVMWSSPAKGLVDGHSPDDHCA